MKMNYQKIILTLSVALVSTSTILVTLAAQKLPFKDNSLQFFLPAFGVLFCSLVMKTIKNLNWIEISDYNEQKLEIILSSLNNTEAIIDQDDKIDVPVELIIQNNNMIKNPNQPSI